MYFSYVCSILAYGDILFCNTSQENIKQINTRTMASNPCKRRRTDLNGDKKREICVYKDAHSKATCSDIAAHFAKEWDVTVGGKKRKVDVS